MKKMKDLIPWRKKETNIDKQSDAPFLKLRRDVDDFFNRSFYPDFFRGRGFLEDHGWYPRVDILEGKKNVTIEAEIPGADSKDIDVSLDGRMLTIKGEKKHEREDKNGNYYHFERSYGCFHRKIELPADVAAEKVDATFRKGILKIKLKKVKEAETKRIEVKAA